MKIPTSPALELARTCCRVLDDKKAGTITVLDVSVQSSITDYLVLATATSEPHLRALRVELEKVLDAAQVHIVGIERAQESGWMVIDAFDVMIHLFLAETRERYGLERLWRDAAEIPLSQILAEPEKKRPAKRASAKSKVAAKSKGKAAPKPRAKRPRA